jgi:hypothetical protein
MVARNRAIGVDRARQYHRKFSQKAVQDRHPPELISQSVLPVQIGNRSQFPETILTVSLLYCLVFWTGVASRRGPTCGPAVILAGIVAPGRRDPLIYRADICSEAVDHRSTLLRGQYTKSKIMWRSLARASRVLDNVLGNWMDIRD